jgi:serine/threonine protein kinase
VATSSIQNERAAEDVISSYATPGTLLAGKYRVERVLGRGGMAVVVAAKHLQLREIVAVKLLHPHVLAHPRAIGRFLREARVAMRLRSDHVARVYDVGALDDRTPFVVMEYLSGDDLRVLLHDRGRLPVRDAVDYVLQACEAIAEAHGLGVVHRDLKPANLFLTTRVDGSPSVKVLDFGVSKTTIALPDDETPRRDFLDDTAPPSLPRMPVSSSGPIGKVEGEVSGSAPDRAGADRTLPSRGTAAVTQTHAFLGSPRYAAPEQLRSAGDTDARADVWALGVILHELVNGEPPFDGETLEEISRAVLEAKPAPWRVPGAKALEPVIQRCLAKDRAGRYLTVDELAEALVPFASEEGALNAVRILRMASVRRGLRSDSSIDREEARGVGPKAPAAKARTGRWVIVAAIAAALGPIAAVSVATRFLHPSPASEPTFEPTARPRLTPPASSLAVAEPSSAQPEPTEPRPAAVVASVTRDPVPVASASPRASASAPPQPPRPSSHPASSASSSPRPTTANPLGVPGGDLFDKRW